MNNETYQQFFNQVSKADRILIVVSKTPNADLAGASTALSLFLDKLNKQAEVLAAADYEPLFPFLPRTGKVRTNLAGANALILVVDTSKKTLAELSYQQEARQVKIFLKSQGEVFVPQDITFEAASEASYDLAIILGAQTLEDLGAVFERHPDVFYEIPKINIDNSPANEYFGAINLVDINASSISEVITALLESYGKDVFDEDIATALLAGLIASTRSFQRPQVTPRTFLRAGALVAKGARHQEIIRHFYKTKSLGFLKLWGRSLVRLKNYRDWVLVVLTSQDLIKAESSLEDVPLVLKELVETLDTKQLWAIWASDGVVSKLWAVVRQSVLPEVLSATFGAGQLLPDKIFLPETSVWVFNLPLESQPEETQQKLESIAAKLFASA